MKINIRPMTVSDIDALGFDEQWIRTRYKQYIEAGVGPAWFVEDDVGPLCAFGAAIYWNNMWCGGVEESISGVCEVWYILITKRKILSQMKALKSYIVEQAGNYGVHRIQAITKKDFGVGARFLEFLGFKCETPEGMEKYFPDGSTALLYSRVL